MQEKPENECYKTANRHNAYIEFHLDEHRRKAFSVGHLINYSVEPNPDAEENKSEPPQKMHLVFSTADVYLLGWRLDYLADRLCEGSLYAVKMVSKRYGQMEQPRIHVSSISIQPIAEKTK